VSDTCGVQTLQARCDGVPVSVRTGTLLPRWSPHPSLWRCSSPRPSTMCQPELSYCASLSTQHLWLSGVRLCRPDSLWNSLPDDSLPDELRNSDSFDNVLNGSRKQFSLAATVSSALEVIFYNEMCYIGRKKQNRRRNVLQSVNINAETLLIN